jgi:Tol biopolymer transport system component/predicted Ser/Thr protein kinase
MSDLIGQTLGPYRIIEQIGIGGMATVYKAYQPSMDRYVAIKVLPALISRDPAFLKRFRRESKVVAKLEHKHILPVYDYGEQESLTYLVMRYVEAGTLKDRLVAGQLDLPEIYRIIGQVGAALGYAHRLGVIHRDVKPTNVLVDSQGDAYLTDFGLARIMESSEQLTATGVGVGTPAYMAPEQGQGLKIDHRSDIYSLGVMLYEMVTGRVPYEAETPMAVVIKHITAPLPLPSSVKPDVPPQVERVILKAMAKDPDDRFQTVGEMVTALDAAVRVAQAEAPALRQALRQAQDVAQVAAGEPAVAKEAAPPSKGFLARARAGVREAMQTGWGRTVMWAAVGIVALLAFFLALSRVPLKVQIRGGQLEVVRVVEATITPGAAVSATTPVLSRSPEQSEGAVEGPTEAVAAKATTTLESLLTATPTRMPGPTATPAVTSTPSPLERGEILEQCGGDLCISSYGGGSAPVGLEGTYSNFWGFSWSPDGSRVAFGACLLEDLLGDPTSGCQPDLFVTNRDGSEVTALLRNPATCYSVPAWSPDGEWIAHQGNCDLVITRPDGTGKRTLVKCSDITCAWFIAWSPDSQRIAWIGGRCSPEGPNIANRVWVINRDGGEMHLVFQSDDPQLAKLIAWSPDGESVAVMLENGVSYLIDADCYDLPNGCDQSSRTEIDAIPKHWIHTFYPQWAGEEEAPPVAAAPTPTLMGRIVYSDGSTGNDEIYVANSDGSDEQRLTDRPAGDWEPVWSPDGTRIVFDSDHHAIGEDRNQLYVVDADGSNLTRLTYTEGNEEHPSWSPDGSRIAFHSNGALAVINPDGANWTTLVEVRDDLCVQHPTWSPDSQRIAFRSKTPCGDPGPFQHDIYVVNDDGSGLLKLASFTSETAGWYVVWSPDGGQVAFDVELDGEWRFYTVNSDGSGEPAEIPSIPDSWYPWYWPQWAGEEAVTTAIPLSVGEQARAFAESILVAIADRPPDYEDDFSDPASGWGVGGQAFSPDVEGETGYMDGEYFMIAAPGACIGAGPPIQRPPSDFVLEVEGRFVSGDTGEWVLNFRQWRSDLTDKEGKYAVMIQSNGQVDVYRFDPESETPLGQIRRVKSGTETNLLWLIAVGPEIALYANGEPVFYVSDSGFSDRFRSGDMLFVVCNRQGTIPLRVQFDNFKIWDISELASPSAEATPAPQPTPRPTPVPLEIPTSSPSAGTGSATGRILWNDEPFAGVVVKLCTDWSMIGGCKGAEYTAVSGADGRYTIADLPPGSYRIATQIPDQEKETGWMGMRAEVQSGEVTQVKDLYVVKYDLQLLSPQEEETVKTATPALTWAGYPHAAYYKVYLAPRGGGEAVIQFEKTAETTYTVASPLQAGKYLWSIHAYNARGTKLAEGSGRFTLAGD